MKHTIALFLLVTFFSAATIYPQTKNPESVYTGLAEKDCQTVESREKGDLWYRGECPGIAGYKLEVLDGDARMTLNIIAPGGKKSELGFDANVSPAFSALGEKAEWRVIKAGKKVKPFALIVRFEISEPDNPVNPGNKSYLVIIKIAEDSACITNVVKPSKNQNAEARKLADKAANKACLAGAETKASLL
jgi:hypothetical protein